MRGAQYCTLDWRGEMLAATQPHLRDPFSMIYSATSAKEPRWCVKMSSTILNIKLKRKRKLRGYFSSGNKIGS